MVNSKYIDSLRQIASAELPWEMLSDCNILVTGATGLIGSALVEALLLRPDKDYHVYALGRNEARMKERLGDLANDPAYHFVRHDVTQPLQGDTPYHYIIHAASNASPNFFATQPVEVMKANLDGVTHLMDYGIGHGLRRFLFVSSGEVYGEGDGRAFSEDYSGYVDPMSPRSCYPSSKRAAETLCAAYAQEYGIEALVARPCHVYGPGFTESDNRVYAQFIRNVLRGEDIVMKSTGSQYRSWCYVVDCVSALLHILLLGQSGLAYNIADESSNITIRELAEMVAEIGGRRVVIDLPSDAERAGYNPVSRSVFTTTRLQAIGWQVSGTMKEKMKQTVAEVTNKSN